MAMAMAMAMAIKGCQWPWALRRVINSII